jgi:putative sigma-54 modulation protein
MRVQVHAVHFSADEKLIRFVRRKLEKLETFYDRMVTGEVFLKLNNEGIENKTVEISLKVPGSTLFAKEQARSFEAATEQATEALRNQLKKFKTKLRPGRV